MTLTVSSPDPLFDKMLDSYEGDVEVVRWDFHSPAPREEFDMVLLPLLSAKPDLSTLEGVKTRLVQTSSIGFDHVTPHLTGQPLANATSVHETATAELTLTLLLSVLRDIPRAVHSRDAKKWDTFTATGLADKKVLLIGYGGIGKAIAARLRPFEVDLIRAASHHREDEFGTVYGQDEVPALLPDADVVILIVPGNAATANMVDADFLAKMKDGALLLNMARGSVADTDALIANADRLKIAFDVVNPEPLPADSPLYTHPNVFFTGHVGGYTDALVPRMTRLIHRQLDHMAKGEELENLIKY